MIRYYGLPTERISIHALREEGDALLRPAVCSVSDFYPRPPRGGRRWYGFVVVGVVPISIHALREEGDAPASLLVFSTPVFLSTPSARRATEREVKTMKNCYISIHALREEGDITEQEETNVEIHFYPRPPRGGRPPEAYTRRSQDNFYPRPPRGGRLDEGEQRHYRVIISIHALREEGDPGGKYVAQCKQDFYPRPPRGGRPWVWPGHTTPTTFLSTPSARRATVLFSECFSRFRISIHALREEGD